MESWERFFQSLNGSPRMQMTLTASVSEWTAFVGIDWSRTAEARARAQRARESNDQERVVDVRAAAVERERATQEAAQIRSRDTEALSALDASRVVRYAPSSTPGQPPSLVREYPSPGQWIDVTV
jgi:hypothetical protein